MTRKRKIRELKVAMENLDGLIAVKLAEEWIDDCPETCPVARIIKDLVKAAKNGINIK